MFFPYDVYESEIDCFDFGAIAIETSATVQPSDNLFAVGRDPVFK